MGNKLVLVTGGARSGKSSFAESQIKLMGQSIAYIATAQAFDEGMKDRIKKHIDQRPKEWPTFECYEYLSPEIEAISQKCDVVLLDCITVMVTNLMFLEEKDWDKLSRNRINAIEAIILEEITKLTDALRQYNLSALLVTNEVGAGIVPENKLARVFRDIAGRVNQHLASQVDEVYFVVSGIPMKIK